MFIWAYTNNPKTTLEGGPPLSPLCWTDNETQLHVLQCRDLRARCHCEDALNTLEQALIKLHTPQGLITIIQPSMGLGTLALALIGNTEEVDFTKLVQQQRDIG